MTVTEPEVLIKQIWQDITLKDEEIRNGSLVDLSYLETQVKAFCELLGTLPAQEALAFEDDLKRIMDTLITWSSFLDERKREVFQNAKELNTHTKAQAAYMTRAAFKADN